VVGVLDALGQLAGERVRRDRQPDPVQVDLHPGAPLPVGEQRQQQLVLAADVAAVAGDHQQRPGARVEQHPQSGAVDGVVAAGHGDLPERGAAAGAEELQLPRPARRAAGPAGAGDEQQQPRPGPGGGHPDQDHGRPRDRQRHVLEQGPLVVGRIQETGEDRAEADAAEHRPGAVRPDVPAQPLRGRQQVRPGRPLRLHANPTRGEIPTHT
jgi:hypothetical protein